MSVAYRLHQFQRAIAATLHSQRPSVDEQALLSELLPPAARALFDSQPVDAQRHSLRVLHDLREAGHNAPALRVPDLWVAALLHDVGKMVAQEAGVPITLWLRGPLVVLERMVPGRLNDWASDCPADGWRYALHVHLHHPTIGAAWAKAASCTPLACWLIAHHQDDPPANAPVHQRELLAALRQADNRN